MTYKIGFYKQFRSGKSGPSWPIFIFKKNGTYTTSDGKVSKINPNLSNYQEIKQKSKIRELEKYFIQRLFS